MHRRSNKNQFMKTNILLVFLITYFSLHSQTVVTATWMSGSNSTEQMGVYGTLGVSAVSNMPGARENSISWKDNNNNLWLFGGNGYGSSSTKGKLNDLWKYNPANNEWTWMGGSGTINQRGTYGTLGVSSSNNIPGGRQNSISWTDNDGNLWLFGGNGYAESGTIGYLNDLWKYDVVNNVWTWVSGAKTANQAAVYGTLGIESSTNVPSARYGAISWFKNNNLYLFGGQVASSTRVNDVWKFNIATGQWSWISGSSSTNQNGVYGTKGISSSSAIPGARQAGVSWTGNDGKFYLFGGDGWPYAGPASYLNDLWSYDPTTNEWVWISGSDTTFDVSNYGTLGIESSSNMPSARQMSISMLGSDGNLWMMGGWGASGINFGRLNDLWKFDLKTQNWTWMGGSSSVDASSTYGSIGVADANNYLGARRMSISWVDSTGAFWIFGGNMSDGSGGSLLLSDLWKMELSNTTSAQYEPINDLSIFPNPVNEYLNIQIPQALKYSLKNVLGEAVKEGILGGNSSINMAELPQGIYFFQVENQKSYKIIKN